jgi:hypothetical protein
MSENDEVKPFHAKGVDPGQETADVVAAVLKHAAERERAAKSKTAPKKQPKWLLPVGVNLAVFAAYLLIWSPEWVVLNPIAPPATEQRVEKLSGAMWLAINKIEAFNLDNERLPQSLMEAGANEASLTDTLVGSSYVLSAEVGEEALVFNSAVQTPREWGIANAGGLSERIGG